MAKHRHTFENFTGICLSHIEINFLRIFSRGYNHWPYYPHHNSFVSLPIKDHFPQTILLLYSHHKYLKSFLYLCKIYSLQMRKTVKYISELYQLKYQLPCSNNFMPYQWQLYFSSWLTPSWMHTTFSYICIYSSLHTHQNWSHTWLLWVVL